MFKISRELRWPMIPLALFLFVFAGWFTGPLVKRVVQQWRAGSFASTQGVVIHSKVIDWRIRSRSRSRHPNWRPEIHYSYQVNGESYQSERLRFDNECNSRRTDADSIVARYPPGKRVTVYYDPASPGTSVLELGVNYHLEGPGLLLIAPLHAGAVFFGAVALEWLASRVLGRPVFGVSVRDNSSRTAIRLYSFSPLVVALGAWGVGGLLAIFGVALVSELIWQFVRLEPPNGVAVALGCAATAIGAFVAWWWTCYFHVEFRRDHQSGVVTVRRTYHGYELLVVSPLESVFPAKSRREATKPAEPWAVPLHLRFFDENGRRRNVHVGQRVTQVESQQIADWLNRSLELSPNKS